MSTALQTAAIGAALCALVAACSSHGDAPSTSAPPEAPRNAATAHTTGGEASPARATAAPPRPVDPAPPDLQVDPADPQDFSAEPARTAPTDEQIAAMMDIASRQYDRNDLQAARASAHAVVAIDPDNVRMLRLIVSCACKLGNADEARTFYSRLPARDAKQIRSRCARYDVKL